MSITNDAVATYVEISPTKALITVDYPNGGFGMEVVIKPPSVSLYDAAYNAATLKASIQGLRLGRFSKETK
jgi:hypothetical protein